MNIPVLVLLGFATWTLVILSVGVGGYRWALILSGRASVAGWRADAPQGADWYQRVMRAHMNCVENLPVYGAIVVALTAVGLRSPLIDGLSETMLAARIGQTLVHVGLRQTNADARWRNDAGFMQYSAFITKYMSRDDQDDAKVVNGFGVLSLIHI